MRPESAATDAARAFSRVDDFLAAWRPLTPWGRDEKEAGRVLDDLAAIDAVLDLTEAWADFASRLRAGSDDAALDRVAFHLGRLPRLPEPIRRGDSPLDAVELFAVRKFASNYKRISALLDGEARRAFDFPEMPRGVEAAFAPLEEGGESFGVSDACDPRLPELRRRLGEIDARANRVRKSEEERVLRATGIDFAGRDFVVSPELPPLEKGEADPLFDAEPWDGHSHVLRRRPGPGEMELGDERAVLLEEERLVEAEVIAAMSNSIADSADALASCVAAIARLDTSRSRSLIAFGPGFSRPRFAPNGGERLSIDCGRLVPLEAECGLAGLKYCPLRLELPERAVLIFGSNMGGKTVVLETALFLQILAQSGFHVPASTFEAPVFPFIHFVGEAASPRRSGKSAASPVGGGTGRGGSAEGGLSGFGREIASLVEAMRLSTEGGLLAFDEFARTTSSGEAEALLSALLATFAARPGVKAVFATHFRGVARAPGTRRLRMRGLDREAAKRAQGREERMDPVARLNSLMRYELVEDSDEGSGSDALVVAGLLGLDPKIVEEASRIYSSALRRADDGSADVAGTRGGDGDRGPEDSPIGGKNS